VKKCEARSVFIWKSYMGLARTTFLIGPDGVVARRWDNIKVDGHADAVLEAVEAL
jgi:peroxiredoxin Q/BCP